MKRALVLLFLSAFTTPLLAWTVAPCESATLAKRAAFGAKVRSAKPGDPLYVRIAFPITNADVIADLVEQFVPLYAGHASRFNGIAEAMKRGVVQYEVARVEDWTPARCTSAGNFGDFFYLLVLRDPSNVVLARARVLESGLFGDLALASTAAAKQSLPVSAVTLTRLTARGISARDPQFVTTWGTLNCHELLPCVASRDTNGIYVQRDDEDFVLPVSGQIVSFRNQLAAPGMMKSAAAKLGLDEFYVSLGGDAFVVAKRLH